MLSPLQLGISSFAVMALAFFSLVAICFKTTKRKWLVLLCIVFFVAMGGVCISILPWIPGMAMAAASLSMSGLSTSYLAVGGGVWLGIWKFLHSGGWRAMLKDWRNALKSLAITGFGVFVLWLLIFVYNFHRIYEVIVVHPSQTQVTWAEIHGVQLTPNSSVHEITPEFLKDHHQYVIEVTPVKGNPISSSVRVRFQFPYVVEQESVYLQNAAQATFAPAVSPYPLIVAGKNATISGQLQYKNWTLDIPEMPPSGGLVRILVLLNSNPKGRVITIGRGPKQEYPPEFSQPPLMGPLYEYIHVTTSYSLGGMPGSTQNYAPFQENSDKIVSVGQFSAPPIGLVEFTEN